MTRLGFDRVQQGGERRVARALGSAVACGSSFANAAPRLPQGLDVVLIARQSACQADFLKPFGRAFEEHLRPPAGAFA